MFMKKMDDFTTKLAECFDEHLISKSQSIGMMSGVSRALCIEEKGDTNMQIKIFTLLVKQFNGKIKGN